MELSVEQDIAAPPEVVFDVMADARREVEWNSQVSRAELVGGEPIGEGTRFRTINRGQEYHATIATHDRPRRLVYEVTGRGMDITATFEFTAAGAGTRFDGRFDMRPKGPLKLAFPLMRRLVQRDLNAQSASLKALAERIAQGDGR